MAGVNVKSEIKPLKKVLLHRPGKELLNLTPNTLEELLFDDIPFLKVAQEEHDAFAEALRDNGVEVVYLEDLTAEVLAADPELRENNIDVIEIPSAELSRGRGGPRCMSMPVVRED